MPIKRLSTRASIPDLDRSYVRCVLPQSTFSLIRSGTCIFSLRENFSSFLLGPTVTEWPSRRGRKNKEFSWHPQ